MVYFRFSSVCLLFIHALCLAFTYCCSYNLLCINSLLMRVILLLTFIYLPDFCNLTMLHLVLMYWFPFRAGGRSRARGSAKWWIYWVSIDDVVYVSSKRGKEWTKSGAETFYFSFHPLNTKERCENDSIIQEGVIFTFIYMGSSLLHLLSAGCLQLFIQPPRQA